MPKSTHFCFTWNSEVWNKNTGLDPLTGKVVPPYVPTNPKIIWMSYSLECGAIGHNYHLQGFMVYKTPVFLESVRREFPKVHIEVQGGSNLQCQEYVSKPETHIRGPWNFGDITSVPENPHKKTGAYKDLIAMVKANKTDTEIIEKYPFFLDHGRAIEKARILFGSRDLSRPVKVFLVTGPPGSGKTEASMYAFPNHFLIVGKYTPTTFSFYRGEPTIILDAFKPTEWPMTVVEQMIKPPITYMDTKYSNTKTVWTTVVITTNYTPSTLYMGEPNRDSLFRRLVRTIFVDYEPEAPAAIKVLDFST